MHTTTVPITGFCRGGNGWFNAKDAEITHLSTGSVVIRVYSKKTGKEAPINLHIRPSEIPGFITAIS
jgi:hypothetical protein